jgi:hypothetical protein
MNATPKVLTGLDETKRNDDKKDAVLDKTELMIELWT